MTDYDHEHQRAATSAFSAGIVLYQTWPQVQDDPAINEMVAVLRDLCDALVRQNPPESTDRMNTLRARYDAYRGGES